MASPVPVNMYSDNDPKLKDWHILRNWHCQQPTFIWSALCLLLCNYHLKMSLFAMWIPYVLSNQSVMGRHFTSWSHGRQSEECWNSGYCCCYSLMILPEPDLKLSGLAGLSGTPPFWATDLSDQLHCCYLNCCTVWVLAHKCCSNILNCCEHSIVFLWLPKVTNRRCFNSFIGHDITVSCSNGLL